MSENKAVIPTPMGAVALTWEDAVLTGVDMDPVEAEGAGAPVPEAIAAQLDAYFEDCSSGFDLELELKGTAFQLRVWKALRDIPPGEAITYGDLAREMGTSARAIGGACRANPCPIVVPCHRVVAANGLGGFAGDTSGRRLDVKRWLLRHEGVDLPGVSASGQGTA
jgi:methylated-DNA-[protein]-cysteine S-methyltransferase